VRALGRRTQLEVTESDLALPLPARADLPRASVGQILRRSARWTAASVVLAFQLLGDRLRKRLDSQQLGVRLRHLFEGMGGTAVKLGQQMSIRVDLLPFEVTLELGKLLDSVPPFPVDEAIEVVERAVGAPLDEVFESFDREPVGSASIACVYRGRLRTGEDVAVKVRRPGIARSFSADLTAINLMTRALELSTLVRPQSFRYLRMELASMLLAELDFAREATHQDLFRRFARRDRIKWLDAPKVHREHSNSEVLVSAFVEGLPAGDLLRIVETQDPEGLRELDRQGITPKMVGRRLFEMSMWGQFEIPFFHADPHPGNLLILPGNELMVLDFGACGYRSNALLTNNLESYRRFVKDDYSGAADVTITMLAPLPAMNVTELRHACHRVWWQWATGAEFREAEWWERTTAMMWVAIMDAVRDLDLPVNLEMLHSLRATLLYDTLVARLDPRHTQKKAFKRWSKAARKRERRRFRRTDPRPAHQSDLAAAAVAELRESAIQGANLLANLSIQPDYERTAVLHKGAALADMALRVLSWSLGLAVFAIVAGLVWAWGQTGGVDWREVTRDLLTHPAVIGGLSLGLLIGLRRVWFRLTDKDDDA